MRVLLASKGESDEIVARALILRANPGAEIDPKKFPARGISVVQRLMPDVVRASHFGFYDMLIVHFDLDDTLAYWIFDRQGKSALAGNTLSHQFHFEHPSGLQASCGAAIGLADPDGIY